MVVAKELPEKDCGSVDEGDRPKSAENADLLSSASDVDSAEEGTGEKDDLAAAQPSPPLDDEATFPRPPAEPARELASRPETVSLGELAVSAPPVACFGGTSSENSVVDVDADAACCETGHDVFDDPVPAPSSCAPAPAPTPPPPPLLP